MNLKKLLLILSLIGTQKVSAISFYDFMHKWFVINRYIGGLGGTVANLANMAYYKAQCPRLPSTPEIVTRFCQEKLIKHDLDPKNVHIKIRKGAFLEAFERNYILFGQDSSQELAMALKNPTAQESDMIISCYSVFLDHEISHLKNNDSFKNLALVVPAALASFAASHYLVNHSRLSYLFQKPTNIKEFFITASAYNILNIVPTYARRMLHSIHAQYRETRADDYAIAKATQAEDLRHAANHLEKFDEAIIKVLSNPSLASNNLPYASQYILRYIHGVLSTQYQVQKPSEDFDTWIKKQTKMVAFTKFMIDPEHPSGFSRAAKMRKATDALEATQQTAIEDLPHAATAA